MASLCILYKSLCFAWSNSISYRIKLGYIEAVANAKRRKKKYARTWILIVEVEKQAIERIERTKPAWCDCETQKLLQFFSSFFFSIFKPFGFLCPQEFIQYHNTIFPPLTASSSLEIRLPTWEVLQETTARLLFMAVRWVRCLVPFQTLSKNDQQLLLQVGIHFSFTK